MLRTIGLVACLLAFLSMPVSAVDETGPARLVADLVPGGSPAPLNASGFAPLGDRSVFVRLDNEAPALWITDGTVAGTTALGVLCPPCGEADLLGSTGSVAFYRVEWAFDDEEMRIWRTDGTPAGTFPVTGPLKEPWGLPETGPRFLTGLAGGRLFFTACTPLAGCELWSSDGSEAGTGPAGEVVAGPESSDLVEMATVADRAFLIVKEADGRTALWSADAPGGLRRIRGVARAGSLIAGDPSSGRVFFLAEDPANGREIWTSDGTAAGTRLVTRFAPGDPFGPNPLLQFIAGRLFFRADDGAHGAELWSLDLGTGRLRRVTDVRDPAGSFSRVWTAGERILFFGLQRLGGDRYQVKLWSSRGDFRSTAPLSGCPGACPSAASGLEPVGEGRFAFVGYDAAGEGFWVTDGTGPGTRLLARTRRPHEFIQSVAVAGRVLFELTDEGEVGDLWATDGTAAGTFHVGKGGPHWSHYYGWAARLQAGAARGHLLFPTRNGAATYYDSLGSNDGTPGGTVLLSLAERPRDSDPSPLIPFRDGVLALDCTGTQNELRFLHGREATLLRAIPTGSCFSLTAAAVDLGGVAILQALGTDGRSLLRTDGTPEGTAPLTPAGAAGPPQLLTRFGDRAAFWVAPSDPSLPLPSELWVTDGSPAGTRKLTDLPPRVEAIGLTTIGGKLFFFDLEFRDDEFFWTPWVSDGTPEGTFALTTGVDFTDLPGSSSGQYFVALDGRAYFPTGRGKDRPAEIWNTDGTPAGTRPAVTAASGMRRPEDVVAVGDRLYFAARRAGDPTRRFLPWVSDGTDAGTEPLADAALAREDTFLTEDRPRVAGLDGRVFFAAADPGHGDELWSTDGTPEGTSRVLDIAPGALGAYPRGLTLWQGKLWFRARDTAHGMELWTTDGTAAGTRLVQDIAPQGSWSTPLALTPAETGLYFTANDGVHGRELWVVETAAGLAASQAVP
jgi:ELWxxDGT repeat protein